MNRRLLLKDFNPKENTSNGIQASGLVTWLSLNIPETLSLRQGIMQKAHAY